MTPIGHRFVVGDHVWAYVTMPPDYRTTDRVAGRFVRAAGGKYLIDCIQANGSTVRRRVRPSRVLPRRHEEASPP